MALMANQHDRIWKWGGGETVSPPPQTAIDTEQFRNVQESERYGIHVSGTKILWLHSFVLYVYGVIINLFIYVGTSQTL